MADRVRREDGFGGMGDMPDISLIDGKLTEKMALTISSKIREMISRFNRGLSLGSGNSGYKAGNLDAQYVDLLFPAADTEVLIPHGLGRRPIGYVVVRRDRACSIYDSSAGSWGRDVLYLKSDTASASVRLLIW